MRVVGVAVLAGLLRPGGAVGQDTPPPLRVTTNLSAEDAVARDAPIEVTLSRSLLRPAERLAVFIDRTDVTGLFRASAQGMSYERGVILLPRGRHELVVYLVEPGSGRWTEVARQPFQTLGRLGFQPGKVDPSLTASYVRRVADGYDPESAAPPETLENMDLQFRLSTEHVRDNLRVSTQAAVVGASKREQALRFRTLGEEAPRVDLSSYRVQAGNGPVELSVGHVSAGNQRQLVNGFSSRGAMVAVRPSGRVELSLAALNGSNEVGWGNVLGMDDSGHRVVTGSLGLEALQTPGALRLEVTGMRGAVRPQAGFNQSVVNDAEESRGVALRVTAAALDRRLRIDAGLARSAFDNPSDPALDQGIAVVDVVEETSGARYLEASLDALRNVGLGGSRTARMTLGYRHERVDPLYRSLGAYTQADRLQDQVDLRTDLAGIGIQANQAAIRNNLDDIASILTTRTRRSQVNVTLPVARVVGRTSTWLPALQYRADRTHQYGEAVPEDGGFSASHVPDQVSLNQTGSVDWRFGTVTVGYRWNRSHQDNRQEGREDADLVVVRNGATVRVTPASTVTLSVDLGLESSENLQQDETDETTRWGTQLQWQVFDRSSFSLRLSNTATEDLLLTRRRANNQVDAQWSSVLPYLSRVQGQYFLRFTRSEAENFNTTFDQDDRRKAWWMDLGLNFTF
jgi:hypothetical protein